jgi:hypothetical protein
MSGTSGFLWDHTSLTDACINCGHGKENHLMYGCTVTVTDLEMTASHGSVSHPCDCLQYESPVKQVTYYADKEARMSLDWAIMIAQRAGLTPKEICRHVITQLECSDEFQETTTGLEKEEEPLSRDQGKTKD